MATALPSTGTAPTTAAPTCDTDDMKIVHGLLRALFSDAPGIVRTVSHTQPRRHAAVSRHIALLSITLAWHHETEDVLLWDELERRAPRCAAHVGVMRAQHAEMAELLHALDDSLVRWTDRGGADDGTVSTRLEHISSSLERHLGDEERWILPVASSTMTQDEWNRLGEMGSSHTPKGMEFVLLGYLIGSIPEATRGAWIRASLPVLVRVLWAVTGRRTFARYRRTLAVDA